MVLMQFSELKEVYVCIITAKSTSLMSIFDEGECLG